MTRITDESEVKDWILREYLKFLQKDNVEDLTEQEEQIYMTYVENLTNNPQAIDLINKDINGEFPMDLTLIDLFMILKTE